jgi:hypothetical protein
MKPGTVAGLWLLLALTVGKLRLLAAVPAPLIQGTLFGLTATLLFLYRRSAKVIEPVRELDIRVLVLFHVTRFVGIYFLYLYSRGRLPFAFAVPGGWGDIAVAVMALGVAAYPAPRVVQVWNLLGLIDILLVVATAARLGLQAPGSMSALTELPLSLLPTFLAPLIIFSHVVIFNRVRPQQQNVVAV